MGLGLNSNVGVGVDYMTAGVGVDYGRMMGTGEISLAISISVGGGGGCELRRTRVLREMLSHNYATLNPRLFFSHPCWRVSFPTCSMLCLYFISCSFSVARSWLPDRRLAKLATIARDIPYVLQLY
jgi:hypothetical protein